MTQPTSNATVLVVDDDPSVTGSLALLLEQRGYRCIEVGTPDDALAVLRDRSCDLVIQDMNFSRSTSGAEGLALLGRIRTQAPQMPVVLLTAWGSIELAVEGMKVGATDFVTKPWDNEQLLRSIATALALTSTAQDDAMAPGPTSRAELDRRFTFDGLLGEDPKLLRLLALIGRVAPTDAAVLISGESGTGKELVAEALHSNSRRRAQPFVKVNLGGVSSTLFESEMFGHVRGAFTDAKRARRGRFELADGGTIFLDEIGEVEPSAQVKLLRVLQDRSYELLGASETRRVDVRVVSATNRDLHAMVADGSFREDLLYRLNLIQIALPPLRERRGDVPLLADAFLTRCADTYGRGDLSLTPEAVDWLRAQPWPGNIRQLKQVIERAVLVSENDRLTIDDLRALADLEPGAEDANADALPAAGSLTLDEIERRMIEKCLEHFAGNVSRAARALGLSRGALYRRCEKHGLTIDRGSPAT